MTKNYLHRKITEYIAAKRQVLYTVPEEKKNIYPSNSQAHQMEKYLLEFMSWLEDQDVHQKRSVEEKRSNEKNLL